MSSKKVRPQKFPPRSPQKKVKRKLGLHWIWIGLLFVSVSVLSAIAGGMLAVSLSTTPLQQVQLSPEEQAVFDGEKISRSTLSLPELTRPVNIIVLGARVTDVDLGATPKIGQAFQLVNSFEGLTDTIMLLRFDPVNKKVVALSIPRDTKAIVDGRGETKINEANDVGGAAGAAKAISRLLQGIAIDRYVRINLQGVEKLIDALGGVTIYVPKDMKYQDDSQRLYIDLKKGRQRLNGSQALQFIRFRNDDNGDIGRVQRQQMLMRALVEQTLNPVTLTRIPQIVGVIQNNIDTNLSVEEFVALGAFGVQVNRSQFETVLLPGEFNGDGRRGVSYWLPDKTKIRQLVALYFDQGFSQPIIINPADVRVSIQDSTKNRTAVRSLAQRLQGIGYQVYIDEPWSEPLATTRILAQGGYGDSAEIIKSTIGVGEVRVDSSGSFRSDITIQIGQDFLKAR